MKKVTAELDIEGSIKYFQMDKRERITFWMREKSQYKSLEG